MKNIYISFMLLALTSCIANSNTRMQPDCINTVSVINGKLENIICPDNKEWRGFSNSYMQFKIPGYIFKFGDNEKPNFDTNPTNVPDKSDDYTIEFLFPTSCDALIMGTLQKNELPDTGGETLIGIVANKEHPFDSHSFPDRLCHAPRTSMDRDKYEHGHGYDGAGAYVLCSEKDGKIVLICISQMTDDPELAEEIFGTFRWIE